MFERSNELNVMHIENNIGLLKSLRNEIFTEKNILHHKGFLKNLIGQKQGIGLQTCKGKLIRENSTPKVVDHPRSQGFLPSHTQYRAEQHTLIIISNMNRVFIDFRPTARNHSSALLYRLSSSLVVSRLRLQFLQYSLSFVVFLAFHFAF